MQLATKPNSILKAILFCIVFTALFVVASFIKSFFPPQYERWMHGITGTAVGLFVTWLFLRFDKKRFADIGLRWERKTLLRFFIGVVIGVIVMGALAYASLYFSDVQISMNPDANVLNFLLGTSALLPLAFMEELGFRAYPLEILKRSSGIRIAIIITSLLFALYHLVNGWSLASSLMGPAVWGLLFGIAAVYSTGIAMPTGLHYAANITTSAFATGKSAVSIWIVTETKTNAIPTGIGTKEIILSLCLLIVSVLCIEVFMPRRKNNNL